MANLRSALALVVGMMAGAALLLAHQVSRATGKPLPAAFRDVPGEAKRIYGELRARSKAGEAKYGVRGESGVEEQNLDSQ